MSSTPKSTTTTALDKWIPLPRQQANCGDNLYARAEKKGKVLRYFHGKYGWSFLGVFKTELSWADNLQIDEFYVSKYCDHAVTGTKKSYCCGDLFEKRDGIAEQYYGYLIGVA